MKLHLRIASKVKMLSLWLVLFTLSATAYASTADSLLLTGSVFNDKHRISEIKINIYVDNNIYKTVIVERSNRFRTNLPLNKMVTVEITAPGFYNKRIMIDTEVPENRPRQLMYDFDMDLYAESEMEGVNTSILDFPVGLIQYQKGKFARNKKYTNQMKSEYMRLLEEAYTSDQGGKMD